MEEFDIAPAPQPQDRIDALNDLLQEAIDLEVLVKHLDADLKAAKGALHTLKSNRIPDLMNEMQMDQTSFRGWSVKIQDFVSGSLPKAPEKREAAIRWLEGHEGGDLIKTSLGLQFGRSEHNKALSVAASLREEGLEPTVESGVHAQTLAAFARERIKNGDPIEPEVLGLFVGKVAKIKEPL